VEEVVRGRWKKFTAVAGRSSPRWVEEVRRGTQLRIDICAVGGILYSFPSAKKRVAEVSLKGL